MEKENFFTKSGLSWEDYSTEQEKSLWELYKNEELYERYVEVSSTNKIEHLFNLFGALKICNKKEFNESFNLGMELDALTHKLMDAMWIRIRFKTNIEISSLYVDCGIEWAAIEEYIATEMDDEAKEFFLPGYKLEKIFDKAEAARKNKDLIIKEMENKVKNLTEKLEAQAENIVQQMIEYCESPTDPTQK